MYSFSRFGFLTCCHSTLYAFVTSVTLLLSHSPPSLPAMTRPPLPRNLNIPRWKPPKPHLAKYHPPPPRPTTDYPHFHPPTSPQLPPRRQPAFNPGGFGLQSQPAPAPAPTSFWDKGKERERQIDEIQKKDDQLRREEEMIEGKSPKEGREEAEACYVVRLSCAHSLIPMLIPYIVHVSRHLRRYITLPPIRCLFFTLPHLFLRSPSPTKHGVRSTLTLQMPFSSTQDYLLLHMSLHEVMTSRRPRPPSLDGGRTLSGRARVSIPTNFSLFAPMSSAGVSAAQARARLTRLETVRHDGRLDSRCSVYTI